MLDDGDEEKEEQIIDLNYQVGMIRGLKEQFLLFQVEVERRLNRLELKNVEIADGGTSQEERGLAVDNFLSGEPTHSFQHPRA